MAQLLGPSRQLMGPQQRCHEACGRPAPNILGSLKTSWWRNGTRNAAVVAHAAAAVQQQSQAEQQQRVQQKQQQRRRIRDGPLPPPLTKKPFLVRIAGRTSSIQGAAGAIVKRLATEDLMRVAAIDNDSISKAVLTLTAANNMLAANNGQMVVFQPTAVNTAAEAPRIPVGSMAFYTAQVMAGEVMAFNACMVKSSTDQKKLTSAIVSRVKENSHTVLECYGSVAVATAVRALAQARKYLRASNQDIAVVIASGRKADPIPQATEGAAEAAAAAAAGAGSSSSSSRYPPTCHRLIVLECQINRPRALLASTSMGMTDRVQYMAAGQQAGAADAGASQQLQAFYGATGGDSSAAAAASTTTAAAPSTPELTS